MNHRRISRGVQGIGGLVAYPRGGLPEPGHEYLKDLST
jgi:hypothetical protein